MLSKTKLKSPGVPIDSAVYRKERLEMMSLEQAKRALWFLSQCAERKGTWFFELQPGFRGNRLYIRDWTGQKTYSEVWASNRGILGVLLGIGKATSY